MSQRHFSPGEHYSSDHADLYLRKGEDYGNVAYISNHTGLAGEPTNEKN